MSPNIPQFVPQQVCLSCDGCCRFKEQNSSWRPKVAKEEIDQIALGLADKIFSKKFTDAQGHIRAVQNGGVCRCTFFNTQYNTCGIYSYRPFECQLYPFLLARKGEEIFISVHLNCPFIQENKGKDAFQRFTGALRNYFGSDDTKNFLKRNPLLAADYSEYEHELEYLFKLEA